MDYEKETYLRNMQQQQDMQHKLQLQHAEQQKQQHQHNQQQQQQHHHQLLQEQTVALAGQQAVFNYQHQQQQHQYHQYLQQQHSYHLQQQQQQQQQQTTEQIQQQLQQQQQQQQQHHEQANNQAQMELHHHTQQQQSQHHQILIQQQQHQQLLRNSNLLHMHLDPQQQQQQQLLLPSMPPTTTPNYTTNHSTITTNAIQPPTPSTQTLAATPTTTITTSNVIPASTTTTDAISTIIRTAATTTTHNDNNISTYSTNTFPTSLSDLEYAAMQQQQQQPQQQSHLNNISSSSSSSSLSTTTAATTSSSSSSLYSNSINKTENTCLPTYSTNPHMNISSNLQNGTENQIQMGYNKYYQSYMNPPPSLPSINPHTSSIVTTVAASTAAATTTTTTIITPIQPTSTAMLENQAKSPTQQQQQQQQTEDEDDMSKDDLKRKNEGENDDSPDLKKMLNDKNNLNSNLRKNIRDVMDETQLDTNTLAAQREESERLARVAEQQKALREYQRQTAANRQFARTQNRVISLLQSGKTYAKYTESNVQDAAVTIDLDMEDKKPHLQQQQQTETTEIFKQEPASVDTSMDDEKSLQSPPSTESNKTERENQQTVGDVVTIEDSSSEDDCILLSDDEDEELMDDDAEDDPHNSGLHVNDNYNVPDELGQVVVNVGHPEGEEDIYVAPQIAKTIKPHQIGGVRFLFDNVIESIKRFKNSSGFGCILAHSMGLGKTLQIVCFCDIFLRYTNSKTVLCVMPINTLQNWVNEFNMWIPKQSDDPTCVRPRHFDVFVLNDQHKTLSARAKVILRWTEQGGVLLIGYELFRLLALKIIPQRRRRGQKQLSGDNASSESHKRLTDSIYQALVKPGPDLVICDEGHRIKNAHAGISVALKQIRTRRRIVLTGYPLQNNLLEYWCMVDFVRPNYLGTRTEFCNMFERPIQNGQCVDSTPEDIKLMRYRAHVLHSLLVGFVQRRSHTVLQQTLPQKLEYVILTRMTTFQRQLYETFMNDVVRTRTVPNPLKAFSVCCKIWNHPDVLYNFLKRHEHDLDIEIEEGEIVPETAPQAAITAAVAPIAVAETTENSVVSANLVEESQTSSSGFSSMRAATPTPAAATNEQKPNICHDGYEHMSYASHNANSVAQTADCNGNNYWLEPNLPYYTPYPNVLPNHNSMQQPDYVGIVVKPNGPGLAESTCSSEIVDLDTKEIKTVETDINMERNTVIKSEQASPVKESDKKDATLELAVKPAEEVIKPVEREITRWSDGVPYDWALDLMKKYEPDLIENSPKMEVFFCILQQSIELSDRVLLFSQSLLTLNLIERFLQANYVPGTESYWGRNISYFRLDGSTNSQERERLITEFNSNFNVKLFLISTRAGSLGINLVGANRVVVFDASWNPCHDTQAVYRIYRYGQRKACYVYRIVMDRCLEKKIYDRQIKKQGMSDRVVDECNPDAHLSLKDVTNLCHDYDDDHKIIPDDENFKTPVDQYLDEVVKKVITDYKGCLSKEPFYHESLLIDRKEKKLSQAEKRQAHRGYEMEKKASVKQTVATTAGSKMQYRVVRNEGVSVARPVQANTTRNTGIRSTRWIPAEVWQRQGMTAQEMTLPLDVVIPTNSSDKSNIILKAGQRVMVLKSAKGIYMQLDSGKIIAIRTSSKSTDSTANSTNGTQNKTTNSHATTTTTPSSINENKSNEVIDITADGDNASNQTTSSISSSSNSNSCSSISNTSKSNYNSMMTTTNTANNNNTVDMKPTITTTNSLFTNNNINNSSSLNATIAANKTNIDNIITTTIKDIKHKTDAFINNGLTMKNNIVQHHQHTHFVGNNGKSTQRRKPTQKIEITSNERLPPIKAFNSNQFATTTKLLTNQTPPLSMTHTKNNSSDHLFEHEQTIKNKKSQPLQQTNEKFTNAQQQKQKMHQQNAAYGNMTTVNHINKPPTPQQQQQQQKQQQETKYTPLQHHIFSGNKTHENLPTNYVQAPPTPAQATRTQLSPPTTTTTTTTTLPGNNSYEAHKNQLQNPIFARPDESQQQQPPQLPSAVSPKNKQKNITTECFQNQNIYQQQTKSNLENNIHDTKLTASLDNHNRNIPATKPINDYLQQQQPPSSLQQQQQHTTSIAGNGSLPTYMQYTPPTATAHPPSLPSPTQTQQLAQTNKMRLYMPQYGVPTPTHTHPHYGNALPPPVSIGAPPVTPTPNVVSAAIAAAPPPAQPPPTVAMLPSTYPKAVHNYPQYYEGMYDCAGNMPGVDYGAPPATHAPLPPPPPPSTAAGYPDYSAYGHHTPYHTNFQANAYACSPLSAPVRAPPYMHWTPLVTSASLAEHHAATNSMFSTANYASDAAAAAAAQANQWHHQ